MGDILLYFINIKKAVSYIEKNLNIKISIRLLSAHCHMSQRNFCRIFKQVFGENPGVYIRRRRLTKAAEKLSSGKITVEKLTFDSGFGSEEVFYRAFKKQFGVTPAGFADRGGLYYAKKRGAMTEGYIKHLLSGGISIKPVRTDETDKNR